MQFHPKTAPSRLEAAPSRSEPVFESAHFRCGAAHNFFSTHQSYRPLYSYPVPQAPLKRCHNTLRVLTDFIDMLVDISEERKGVTATCPPRFFHPNYNQRFKLW